MTAVPYPARPNPSDYPPNQRGGSRRLPQRRTGSAGDGYRSGSGHAAAPQLWHRRAYARVAQQTQRTIDRNRVLQAHSHQSRQVNCAQVGRRQLVRPSQITQPQRQLQQRAWVLDNLARIGIHLVWTTAALAGICQLLPVQFAQQNRLREIDREVTILSDRVQYLQHQIEQATFDPLGSQAAIKERFNYLPPNQLQVLMVEPRSSTQTDMAQTQNTQNQDT